MPSLTSGPTAMLTPEQITAELANYSWLPGYRFETYVDPWEGLFIRIRCDAVPNAYRPDETVPLDIHVPVPPIPDLAYLHVWMDWRLRRCALHEHREFLRFKGEILFDPHKHPART